MSDSEVATLVLLRHGESTWNQENRFTGWTDVPLAPEGLAEAQTAGELLRDGKYDFDVCYTSVLKRAIKTLWTVLEGLDRMWLPVKRDYRLNERMYGALQGLDKSETADKHGEDKVKIWRRAYAIAPPALEQSDERWPGNDPRYAHLKPEQIPLTECLKDTVERFLPLWHDEIAPQIKDGKRVLIAAHGNSIRALVKYLDDVSEDEITELNIPTGVPLVYKLDRKTLKPIEHFYLGDEDAVAAKMAAVAAQGQKKP